MHINFIRHATIQIFRFLVCKTENVIPSAFLFYLRISAAHKLPTRVSYQLLLPASTHVGRIYPRLVGRRVQKRTPLIQIIHRHLVLKGMRLLEPTKAFTESSVCVLCRVLLFLYNLLIHSNVCIGCNTESRKPPKPLADRSVAQLGEVRTPGAGSPGSRLCDAQYFRASLE